MRHFRRLLAGRRGTSYSLPFVMLVPFYLTFMLTAVEAGFLFVAKIGTQYAAYAGCRAAVVWGSAQPAELRDDRVRQAVFTGLAPYIGGRQRELDNAGPLPPGTDEAAADYAAAVAKSAPETARNDPGSGRWYARAVAAAVDAEFLKRKYKVAAARTRVELTADPSGPDGDVTVKVEFRAPLYMPVVSRFLDPDRAAPFELPITSAVTLQNDAPKTRLHMPTTRPERQLALTPSAEVPTLAPDPRPGKRRAGPDHPLGIAYFSADRK